MCSAHQKSTSWTCKHARSAHSLAPGGWYHSPSKQGGVDLAGSLSRVLGWFQGIRTAKRLGATALMDQPGGHEKNLPAQGYGSASVCRGLPAKALEAEEVATRASAVARPTLLDICPLVQAVLDMQRELLALVAAGRQGILAGRQPLQRRKAAQQGLRTFNPRFEDDFALGKDFDPDRCGACPV